VEKTEKADEDVEMQRSEVSNEYAARLGGIKNCFRQPPESHTQERVARKTGQFEP